MCLVWTNAESELNDMGLDPDDLPVLDFGSLPFPLLPVGEWIRFFFLAFWDAQGEEERMSAW